MSRCFIVQPIHPAGLERLAEAGVQPVMASGADPASVLREIGDADAVITRNAGLSGEAIAAAPHLRVIAVHGTGTDPVAIDAATRRGIPVVNTPHANVRSVAEQAIALTFALAKQTLPSDRAVRAGDAGFRYRARLTELAGATFGVVGFGNIGRATAQLALAMGMKVVGFSRSRSDADFVAAGVRRCGSLDELLRVSDVVSVHVSLTDVTRQMIGARELGLMQPTAVLINTARGGVVDDAALAEALVRGQIAGAGLDVFAHEPLDVRSPLALLDNVVLSPHVAGSTAQALERTALAAASEVVAVLSGKRPINVVNPEAWRVADGAAGGGH